MKERLINNLGLKILSILLAAFIWLVVVNVSNPEVTRSKEVQLEIDNEQVLLAADRTYEVSGKGTVTVTYDVRTRDEYKIRATDFKASVDLAELYDVTGSVPVKVEVLNNKELLSNAAAKPGVVRVDTEELQTKEFAVNKMTTGETEEGYAPNSITTTPEKVTVSGPMSQVGLISFVGVQIELDGLSEDKSGTGPLEFYDSNGSELSLGDNVSANITEIAYHVVINRVKKVSLDFEVAGTVAHGYQYAGVECSTKTVSVAGLKTNLASFNKITVPSSVLNIDGATADKVVTVDLRQYLPEGVEIVQSEQPEIEVRLKVERLSTRVFHLTKDEIAMTGVSDTNNYTLNPERIDVTMRGLGEDLDSLTAKDLKASLDVTGLASGMHKGTLTFAKSDVFSMVSYTDFEVGVEAKNVMIGVGPSGTETSASAPEETETTKATLAGTEGTPETKEAAEESGTSAASQGQKEE